jgi:hypothetical protein
MWFNLAAGNEEEYWGFLENWGLDYRDAAKARDELAKKMTPAQIAEAQRLSREWIAQHQ